MALGDIWASINDKCWPILDALHLSSFFEKYSLPPILFPLMILLVILALIFALSQGGAPAPKCGDSICDPSLNETHDTCPQDCKVPEPQGKKLTLELDKLPQCQISVKLYDSAGDQKGTQRGSRGSFTFDGIEKDIAYITIVGPYDETQTVPPIALKDKETSASVTLSSTICKAPEPARGIFRVVVKDSSNTPLNGVSVSIRESQSGPYVVQNQLVNNQYDFTLPSGKAYTVYAQKEGYVGYESADGEVSITSGGTQSKTLLLSLTAPEAGDLEVCVKNGTAPMMQGLIAVQDASGNVIAAGDVSQSDPATEPSYPNCLVFEKIPTGTIVSTSMPNPPAGCIPAAGAPPTTTIASGSRKTLDLEIQCESGNIGYLKVKVIGTNGITLTKNATITLWTQDARLIPGNGLANSLAFGDRDYTEEVTVPASEPIYAWVRGLPLGYLDYKSPAITLLPKEHKSLDVALNYTAAYAASKNFTFVGVFCPAVLSKNQTFEATVDGILYGGEELDAGEVDVTAKLGGVDCNISYLNKWIFACRTAGTPASYDLIITARRSGAYGEHAISIDVREYGDYGVLTIRPLASRSGEPPLSLVYAIELNGTQVTQLTAQSITVTYLDSPSAYPGRASDLSLDDSGRWLLTADVPYKGDYELQLFVETTNNSRYYNATYTSGITATSHSEKLKANVRASKDILGMLESFSTYVELVFDDELAYGLDIFEMYLDRVFYTLIWDETEELYILQLVSPDTELCAAKMKFLIKDEEVTEPYEIYTIDISETKSGTCPMSRESACGNIEDVRKCVAEHLTGAAYYAQDQLTACIKSGCAIAPLASCPTSNTGDLDLNCRLSEEDANMFSEYMIVITSVTDRNSLVECMDMDNDEDVDDDDLSCLTNMISTKWYGDIEGSYSGDECTPSELNGGFCFDINVDSDIPGDLNGDGKLDASDEEIMQNIIYAVSADVTPHEDILAIADFNQDDTVTNTDLDCLQKFFTVDFQTGDVIPPSTTIPQDCMEIFGLDCLGSKGDLNADGRITTMDLIIMRFIVWEILQNPSGLFSCADIDENDLVDEYDLECLESYFSGDKTLWLSCIGCEANLPVNASNSVEICNDGWDNDCDGLTDDQDTRCACGSGTPCAMKWDSDSGMTIGIADGNYKTCANFGSGYKWVNSTAINSKCNTSSSWKTTYKCGNDVKFTCVFSYKKSFKYPDTSTNGTFAWLEGNGNIGPLGVTDDCDKNGHPDCATGWTSVHTSEGTECGTEWEKWCEGKTKRCNFCRFNYDFCQNLTCSPSGEDVATDVSEEHSDCAGVPTTCYYGVGNPIIAECASDLDTYNGPAYNWCASGWGNYNEVCATAGECMGEWNPTNST